uniref:Uncharacterized protein n=1 Tax=Cannabis sativa TaxID=3483 RepID=A0A803Q981_CANSA
MQTFKVGDLILRRKWNFLLYTSKAQGNGVYYWSGTNAASPSATLVYLLARMKAPTFAAVVVCYLVVEVVEVPLVVVVEFVAVVAVVVIGMVSTWSAIGLGSCVACLRSPSPLGDYCLSTATLAFLACFPKPIGGWGHLA